MISVDLKWFKLQTLCITTQYSSMHCKKYVTSTVWAHMIVQFRRAYNGANALRGWET